MALEFVLVELKFRVLHYTVTYILLNYYLRLPVELEYFGSSNIKHVFRVTQSSSSVRHLHLCDYCIEQYCNIGTTQGTSFDINFHSN